MILYEHNKIVDLFDALKLFFFQKEVIFISPYA